MAVPDFFLYRSDFSLDWQKVIPLQGRQYSDQRVMGYDPAAGRILLRFYSKNNLTNTIGSMVLSEWGIDGSPHWQRQMPVLMWCKKHSTRACGGQDWLLETADADGGGVYGKGNSIIVGP